MSFHVNIIYSLLVVTSCFSQAKAADSLALVNAHLVRPSLSKIDSNHSILIVGKTISGILGPEEVIPDGFRQVDLEGAHLMPGMIDVHTHLSSLASARIALMSGVTTVRTAGVAAFQDVTLSQLVADGHIAGPDVIPAGVYVTPNLGETVLADPRLGSLMAGVDDAQKLRELVRINADRGAKVIKTRGTERAGRPDTDPRKQTYTESQLEAVVDEAAKFGLPVMIHAHGDEGARAAVLAGARSIEHGTFLSEETLRLMAEKGTYLVPTFITLMDLIEPGGDYDQPVVNMRGRYMIPKSEAMIRKALDLGVTFATGADNSYLDASTSRVSMEAMHFLRLGMEPWEVLRALTTNGAKLLGLTQTTGTLTVGAEADIIAVLDNPLDNIRALQDVVTVISNGQIVINRLPFGIED
ncbi:MAG: amidohydrolase family protein [Saprospiraceae bacterium]|nr:amidohydrolase family protein [Saprospiraceae bacterium]